MRGRIGDEPAATLPAALSAWQRIGATAKAATLRGAIRAAGLPVPVPGPEANSRRTRDPVNATGIDTSPPSSNRVDAGGQGEEQLTARERALAWLVHDGRTNQQIANTLHISVKTVEACLTRIYRKTSCASRVELAVAVTQQRVDVGDEATTTGPDGQARQGDDRRTRR